MTRRPTRGLERLAVRSILLLAMGCAGSEGTPAATRSSTEPPAPSVSRHPEPRSLGGTTAPESPGATGGTSDEAEAPADSLQHACEANDDCGWDDPCVPQRCVGAPDAEPSEVACNESRPAPGECLCAVGRCTLRRTEAPEPVAGCGGGFCSLDPSAGRCVTARTGTAGSPARGPYCYCDGVDDTCRFEWREPIPCRTTNDCWVDGGRPVRPVRRPRRLRGRTFRPCVDGETAPTCNDEGFCDFVPLIFSC